MKEVLLYDAKDLRLIESPKPTCGPNNVLVKLQACAICPTDLRKYSFGKMGSPLIHLPMNMGHEWTGDVVEVGEYVDYPKVGMRIRGIGWGGYAEYTTVDVRRFARMGRRVEDVLVELPENVSYAEGTFVENVQIGIHAVVDQAGGGLGKTIVIIGAGQMGLTQIMIAKLIGATTIVTEVLDWRLELAEKYGADHIVNVSKEDPVEAVRRITKGKMADGAIITVGIPAAIIQGLSVLGNNGRAVLFGGATLDTTVTFNPNMIHYGDKALVGCTGGPPRGQLSMELIASGKVPVKGLISHTFKLEELPDAFEKITTNKLERYLKGMVVC
ncbi:MAG: zinc-binding dehydrogenase [Candidatus Bathyarchaeia archaeon]